MPKSETRVLLYIPAGNGVPAERVTATNISRAKELIEIGQGDPNAWFAGARIIEDVNDYPRFGYKECPENGVVRDESSKHYTRAVLERMEDEKNRDTVTDATEGALKAQMIQMQKQMDEMSQLMTKSSAQVQAEEKHVEKERDEDFKAVTGKKAPAKKKKAIEVKTEE